MAKIQIERPSDAQKVVDGFVESLTRRLQQGSLDACPVEFAHAMVQACATQSCGKCTPCRIGLRQMDALMGKILDGEASAADIDALARLAEGAYLTADCAIGYMAADAVRTALKKFRADFAYHARTGNCSLPRPAAVPCTSGCPAHVDIPGYVALVAAGRYEDAVRLIRKDNPFVMACGLICEHPCEAHCRRGIVDAPINIRALKRFAADNSSNAYTPFHYEKTGKKVAIIGGGPAGLTAAYYLALMGHEPTIYEQRAHLGGMMRYGIPAYRLPREVLQGEIDWMLAQGINVKLNTSVPDDVSFEELRESYDALYVAIGAHSANKMRVPNEEVEGVLSAVQLLGAIGDGQAPDFTGRRVCVVGGGNVAMDIARSSVRLGAEHVTIVYRRTIDDMTAQRAEIDGAIAEGCELLELHAPIEVLAEDDRVVGLRVQPQIAGLMENGRPKPMAAEADPIDLPCDYVLTAIGQAIVSEPFADAGITTARGKLVANAWQEVDGMPGVFAGGDCESGPSTVIRAVASGKVAACNIDDYLGFSHVIKAEVEVPVAQPSDKPACGRAKTAEVAVCERADCFDLMEMGYTLQEATQEAGRCLRCDCFGMGSFRGGRSQQW